MKSFPSLSILVPAVFVLCAGLPLSGRFLFAQTPPRFERVPSKAVFHYEDLRRFAEAFEQIEIDCPAPSGSSSTCSPDTILDSVYLAPKTRGLRAYADMYDLDAPVLARRMAMEPEIYHRVANEALSTVRALEPRIRDVYREYQRLYPDTLFPPVYYLVAHRRAGGTVEREGIFIAVEMYARSSTDPGNPSGRDLTDLVHLVAHELSHYQQAVSDLESCQSSNSLLARAIKEGTADYLAELVSGHHINQRAHGYGTKHEWELWSQFRCEMERTATGDWFFTDPETKDWPQDLGYFVGYAITQSYVDRRNNLTAAVREIIQVTDYPAFLEASGYESRLVAREGKAFPQCVAK